MKAVLEYIVPLREELELEQFGGSSVMAWSGLTARGITPKEVANGNLAGVHYRDIIFHRQCLRLYRDSIQLHQVNVGPPVG